MTTITIPRETFDQMREALEDLKRQYKDQPSIYMDWSKAREALSAAKEVQPQAQGDAIAHIRARTSQHKWNSYELCQADDPNGIAVYAHPQASEPAAPEATK